MSKSQLSRQLVQLNREFYSTFATAFAGSRSLAQPSLHQLLTMVPPAASVLDVGCGHGRIAHLLDQERPGGSYLGLDFSAEFVRLAREGATELQQIEHRFEELDLTRPGWEAILGELHFDSILILSVLHHIPGFENRLAILRALRGHLKDGGRLIVSAWQFTTNARHAAQDCPLGPSWA